MRFVSLASFWLEESWRSPTEENSRLFLVLKQLQSNSTSSSSSSSTTTTNSSQCSSSLLFSQVEEALSLPFLVTAASYDGNFMNANLLNHGETMLQKACHCFGPVGSIHHMFENGSFAVSSVHREINYALFTLDLHGAGKISFKLYATLYFQIYGVASDRVAQQLISWLGETLLVYENERLFNGYMNFRLLSQSCFHEGVSECNGIRLNLDVLESAYAAEFGSTVSVTRHTKNKSVIVRNIEQPGSQIFHSTGTIQLLGVRESTGAVLEKLKTVLAKNESIIEISDSKKKRRRGQSGVTAALRASQQQSPEQTADALLSRVMFGSQDSDTAGASERAIAEVVDAAEKIISLSGESRKRKKCTKEALLSDAEAEELAVLLFAN